MSLLLCDLSELKKTSALSRLAMWQAFVLMLGAMRRVHEGGILHRDVKPSNFGLAWQGKGGGVGEEGGVRAGGRRGMGGRGGRGMGRWGGGWGVT